MFYTPKCFLFSPFAWFWTLISPCVDVVSSLHLSVWFGVSGRQGDHHGRGDLQHAGRGLQQPHPLCQSQQWLVSVLLCVCLHHRLNKRTGQAVSGTWSKYGSAFNLHSFQWPPGGDAIVYKKKTVRKWAYNPPVITNACLCGCVSISHTSSLISSPFLCSWVIFEHSNYRGRQFLLEPIEITNWPKFSSIQTVGSMYPVRQVCYQVMLSAPFNTTCLTRQNMHPSD